MKILKQGKLPQDKTRRGTCQNCGCRVEFQQFEAEYVHDFRDGGFYKIKCPTRNCNGEIISAHK